MHRLLRLLLYLLVAQGAFRVVLYLDYAASMLPRPTESHNLEAKFVLLAYRACRGLSLYPDWRNYPYVSNWFGPVGSLLVGLAGRAGGCDIPGLFAIGRAVSFGAALLTTLVLAGVIGRRDGAGAGLAAGLLSLGSGAMYGFTVMVRPDALAELLGTGGFFLAGGRTRRAQGAGLVLLVLAILTKQIALVFLLAAALALVLEGKGRRGLVLVGAACGLVAVTVIAVTALGEPHFAISLVGERTMPWSHAAWRRLLDRMTAGCPELFVFPAIGLVLWLGDRSRPGALGSAVLTLVLLAGSLGLSGKLGADMNYYMSLRIPLALCVGTLWQRTGRPAAGEETARRGLAAALAMAAALVVANLLLVPSILLGSGYVVLARNEAANQASPQGRLVLRSYHEAFALARNPQVHLLTDAGLIDLYQGERAVFGDPWLFRTLVETGQLQPTTLLERIESQYYDIIITRHDLDSPRYLQEDFRLPRAVVERIRARYTLKEVSPGLFAYVRSAMAGVP
jgi:hypothetical protein